MCSLPFCILNFFTNAQKSLSIPFSILTRNNNGINSPYRLQSIIFNTQ